MCHPRLSIYYTISILHTQRLARHRGHDIQHNGLVALDAIKGSQQNILPHLTTRPTAISFILIITGEDMQTLDGTMSFNTAHFV